MPLRVPLRCRCGSMQGFVDVTPSRGNRIVCMCDDCQAFVKYLGRTDVLDAHGGTDIYRTAPSDVVITQGQEHLRCLRLSDRGMVRWYASCCRTPIGNTLASGTLRFVGLIDGILDPTREGRSRDEALGTVTAYVWGAFAIGEMPRGAYAKMPPRVILRAMKVLYAGFQDRWKDNPFFDRAGRPSRTPEVLGNAQRDALRV